MNILKENEESVLLNDIHLIIDKWFNERLIIMNKMAKDSIIQQDYKNQVKDKIEKLFVYVKENFDFDN